MPTEKTHNRVCVTYFQARGLPLRKGHKRWRRLWKSRAIKREDVANRLKSNLEFEIDSLDDFYDVASKDSKMFQRFTGYPISFEHSRIAELVEQNIDILVEQPRVSVLLTPTNYYILGIDIEFWVPSDLNYEVVVGILSDLAHISQEQSESTPKKIEWRLDHRLECGEKWEEDAPACSASIRRVFDLLGFTLHEAILGRSSTAKELMEWSQTWENSENRCREMHEAGEIITPYVATWGYHSDFKDLKISGFFENWIVHPKRPVSPQEIICREMLDTRKIELNNDVAIVNRSRRDNAPIWVIGDFESIRVFTDERDIGTVEEDARSLIEYLAYRRGIVTSIQRDIARCSNQKAAVHRKQVARWLWTLATATDDYILAGWNVGLLRRVRAAIQNDLHNWDLEHREKQVRQRLEGVQAQLQAEQGRLSTALALVFGLFAFASLLPLLSFIFAWKLGNPSVTDAPLEQPWTFLGVALGLLALLLILSTWLFRRAGRLRSPGRDPTL